MMRFYLSVLSGVKESHVKVVINVNHNDPYTYV